MAKWTGNIKTVRRWFRSPKYLVELEKDTRDLTAPNSPELYWCEVDALRLDLIAFDLTCRRRELEAVRSENARLRAKLIKVGSDPKPDDVDLRTAEDCKHRFGEEELEPFAWSPTRVLNEGESVIDGIPVKTGTYVVGSRPPACLEGDPVKGFRVAYDLGKPVHTPNPPGGYQPVLTEEEKTRPAHPPKGR